MNSDLKGEDILYRVKEKLNQDKIKLWLNPYYDETDGVGNAEEEALQLLCKKITEELNIDQEQCICALRDLQNHALDRLKSNTVFNETGVACLKVKVSGETPRIFTVNISLTASASELVKEVSSGCGISSDRVKLISHGRVLKPQESLCSQGVKNAMQLMAVILADDGKLRDDEERFKMLESTKRDVQLLAGRSNENNEFYLQLENQAGKALDLPYHERKILVSAMALHEKGRVALKKEDYSLALVLFLEADKEYSECTSQLLNIVDNYALLQLDIAWCYLCLRNPAQIPDAEKRLRQCEQNFHKSYGPNMERLMAIKGSTGNENALFMRLHLLQGVVHFHQNNRADAKKLFERAQSELSRLKVDDNSLCLLLELGFTDKEARLGLRATYGNVEMAEELLRNKCKERERTKKQNRTQLKNERERIKLGLCADGRQYCEPGFVEQLVAMGFDHGQSVAALKLSNNVLVEAINLIQEQPHLLPSDSVSQESIAQITSLGFEPEVAREALNRFPELARAVQSAGNLSAFQDAGNSTATTSTSAFSLLKDLSKKFQAKVLEEKQAFERVSEGLIDSDLTEDHLDLNLAQEEQFLMEYMSLLD